MKKLKKYKPTKIRKLKSKDRCNGINKDGSRCNGYATLCGYCMAHYSMKRWGKLTCKR